MNAKILFSTFVMLAIILITPACGNQPYIPPSLTPTQISPTSLPSLNVTSTDLPTLLPTLTFTAFVTLTDTALPSLPDFDEVINFALGGGSLCGGATLPESHVRVSNGKAFVCFRDTLGPIQLDWYAPDGRIFSSSVDTTSLTEYIFRWPLTILPGQGQLHAYGNGYSEYIDFNITLDDNFPQINAIDSRSREINTVFEVALKENGNLDVIGINYPANTLIYILLYQASSTSNEHRLIYKQAVLSDASGSIYTELTAPFEYGDTYLIVGISDPNADLVDSEKYLNASLPLDYFQVKNSKSSS